MQPVFDGPVRNCQKPVKTHPDASKIVDLQLGAPNGAGFVYMARFSKYGYNAIKQIRGFAGSILQPEMKPPKIIPDPKKNKKGKEMNLLILTIQSSLRYDPSGTNTPFRLRPEGSV